MDKVKISIVIPVYNAENFLDSCLSSILVQKMTSYEVILVDDGSTDSSPLICDRYSATDSRFRTIHKKNGESVRQEMPVWRWLRGIRDVCGFG